MLFAPIKGKKTTKQTYKKTPVNLIGHWFPMILIPHDFPLAATKSENTRKLE